MATKLNALNLMKLIDTLRSGAYAQGQHTMKTDDNKFCCLGVAHDCLIGPVPDDSSTRLTVLTEPEYEAVTQALGLPYGTKYRLSAMNDSGHKTFDDIANYLEGMLHAAQNDVTV